MATSFFGLKSPEERNRWKERGREREEEEGVQLVGKAKSQLWDKGRGRDFLNLARISFCGRGSEFTEQGR